MYTAAELIHALQRRLQLTAPHLRRPPGEFPPGWKVWLDSIPARVGAVTGATAQAIIDIFLARPLAERPRRSGELTRWQAFGTLWRQEWHGPAPEDRRTHLIASTITLLWHLLFGALLLWLFVMRLFAVEDEASKRRGEDVVQVEFIGVGTPEEVGGGQTQQAPQASQAPAQEQVAEAAEAAEAAPALPVTAVEAPAPEVPDVAAPVAEVQPREVPEPTPAPTPPVEQRVDVSAPTPDATAFVLRAPTPQIAPREVVVREVAQPDPSLTAIEVPAPVQVQQRDVQSREVAARPIEARVPQVAVREVAAPLQQSRQVQVATPSVAQPSVRAPDTAVRTRDIPVPRPATATSPASGARPASASAPAASAPASGTAPAASASQPTSPGRSTASSATTAPGTTGAQPSVSAPGQGPRPVSAPGAFPSTARSDDWGASTRNVPGGQRGEPSGLYNADGGPRLSESPINTGQPPGTLDDRIVDLDRSGTWLKRRPNDYEPTSLDKYWRPHETLLQEWVRKGIKRMAIPIPGTGKKIECIVSLLQMGGGCGISDPNLNDQPARARPPPNVPFKPHLQEDNGSVKPPAEG